MITKDIHFRIEPDEMDTLFEHYGKGCATGFIYYRKFDDDIYYINKKEKNKRQTTKGQAHMKEEEVKKTRELHISIRPPVNVPTETRYSMRNTVVGQYPDSRKQRKHTVKISDSILQDIIKATYLRDHLIQDAFTDFGKGRGKILNKDDLKEAFETYGIKQEPKILESTYDRLKGDERELTAELIDLAVEDNAKKSIEEIQKMILEKVNRGVKQQPETPPKNAFLQFDKNERGSVTFEQFKKCIHNYANNIKTEDVMFLAKRYCDRDDD